MSQRCGLKKLMCPGPIGKGCPFSRNDCSFHEEGDGVITTVGQAAAGIARRAAESVNEDQRRRS